MAIEKQAVLTTEAEKELGRAIQSYRDKLIEDAREGLFIPGEDVVEISGSDIRRAVGGGKSAFYFRAKESGVVLTKMVGILYIVGGLAAVVIGFLWQPINELIRSRQIEVQIIFAGLGTSVVGFITLFYVRYREAARLRDLYERRKYSKYFKMKLDDR